MSIENVDKQVIIKQTQHEGVIAAYVERLQLYHIETTNPDGSKQRNYYSADQFVIVEPVPAPETVEAIIEHDGVGIDEDGKEVSHKAGETVELEKAAILTEEPSVEPTGEFSQPLEAEATTTPPAETTVAEEEKPSEAPSAA